MTSCRRSSNLVVVDSRVADYADLAEHLVLDAQVLVLDQAQDGVVQITQALAENGAVQSVHILAHGRSGSLQLGTTQLSQQTLGQYAASLRSWANQWAGRAEILLYSCEVAAGAVGEWFVKQLKELTGAEIAASSSLIGNVALGGNWALEFSTAKIQTPLVFSPSAMSAYPHVLADLVIDSFRGSDVVDKNWLFGVGDPVAGVTPANPFLTARPTVTAPSGGLPGNPGTPDAAGEGALRLTNSTRNQASFVLYNKPILSRDGLTITFEIFSYDGDGADGISFFLLDGNTVFPAQPRAGAFGGSLGYAQRLAGTTGVVAGLDGAFVGIGLDEYGNFSSATDVAGGVTVREGGTGRVQDSISIRAGESANYRFVEGTETLPFGIDNPTATNREAANVKRTVKVDLTPEGLLSVRIDGNNDGDYLDPGESNPDLLNQDIDGINGVAVPTTLKFGFAAGTGDFTNIHELRNLNVSTLNSPPETVSFSRAILPSNTKLLTGFEATDPDVAAGDSVASFTILSLPTADQGALYLGNPSSGGRRITLGEDLTPQEIQTVFFQAGAGFTGSTFTYTATDSRGASDLTPATVTLTRGTTPDPDPDNRLPNTAPSSLTLPASSTARVPDLSGTDPDGTVTSFRIVTLPALSQGLLFLGDPAAGGKAIVVGQTLTPDEIKQVYFQSSGSFSGGQFTYAAIDNRGGVDPSPARVDLILKGVVDPVVCQPGEKLKGTEGNDDLEGEVDFDRLWGRGGNDRLRGFACNDMLDGGRNNDRLAGGGARDILMGRQNKDAARGQAGADVIILGLGFDKGYGGRGNDEVRGNRGGDLLKGRNGDDRLYGGRGKDELFGGTNNDVMDGQQGNDFLKGAKGEDIQNGGLGADKHRGGRRSDRIVGRRGADIIWGGKGSDELIGSRGNDRIAGHVQPDRIVGGSGDDRIIGGGGNDRIRTGSGADRITYKNAFQGIDRIADFNVALDEINLEPVFKDSKYSSSTPFEDYVKLTASGSGTILSVDSNGEERGGFVRLAVFPGVDINSFSASNFRV